MLFGSPPFTSDNPSRLYNLIRLSDVKFPKKIKISPEAEDLIMGVNLKIKLKSIKFNIDEK